jgi:cyclopropane-fatty-acyl-phospholipid synthase
MDAIKFLEQRIRHGRLCLHFPGREHCVGSGQPEADWILRSPQVLNRIALDPEMRLGESYMAGEWDAGDQGLLPLLEILLRNFPHNPARGLGRLGQQFLQWRRQWNRLLTSRRNVIHHYGRDDDLFRYFLDAEMHYSCAYFAEPHISLEQAQRAKCRHIMNKLLLSPGQRVLDIGCGWGGLACYLAENAGVHVTGLSLAPNQLEVARQRARERGLERHTHFLLEDYRRHRGRYDRIVSVGMFEHVGLPNYRAYFDGIKRQLHADGVALVHTIGNFTATGGANPWLERYIFHGSDCPLLSNIHRAVEGSALISTDIEVLRLHYALTLGAWLERLQLHRNEVVRRWGARFYRMWEFYLASCAAAFRWRDVVVFQLQLAQQLDAVPNTRDYLYPAETDWPQKAATVVPLHPARHERRSSRGDRRKASAHQAPSS